MKELVQQVIKEKLIVIVRGLPNEEILNTVEALRLAGVKFVEVTFSQNSPTCVEDTYRAIRYISENFKDILVGAGTVLTEEQLEAAYSAGAKYIISPNTNVSIIQKTVALGMMSMPGALTPTEIVTAYEAGASFVKLFPVDSLGPDYIKAVRAPLSHIPMTAVGGVNLDNLGTFYKAGVSGFGIGGNIVDKKLIASGDFAGLTRLAKNYVDAIAKL